MRDLSVRQTFTHQNEDFAFARTKAPLDRTGWLAGKYEAVALRQLAIIPSRQSKLDERTRQGIVPHGSKDFRYCPIRDDHCVAIACLSAFMDGSDESIALAVATRGDHSRRELTEIPCLGSRRVRRYLRQELHCELIIGAGSTHEREERLMRGAQPRLYLARRMKMGRYVDFFKA
jgi:hypothetical protein